MSVTILTSCLMSYDDFKRFQAFMELSNNNIKSNDSLLRNNEVNTSSSQETASCSRESSSQDLSVPSPQSNYYNNNIKVSDSSINQWIGIFHIN